MRLHQWTHGMQCTACCHANLSSIKNKDVTFCASQFNFTRSVYTWSPDGEKVRCRVLLFSTSRQCSLATFASENKRNKMTFGCERNCFYFYLLFAPDWLLKVTIVMKIQLTFHAPRYELNCCLALLFPSFYHSIECFTNCYPALSSKVYFKRLICTHWK